MTKQQSIADEARQLLLNETHGALSTHSIDMKGYPFGSVVPYCLGANGEPIILISNIAQHTKNILGDAKVSLIVMESEIDDIQAGARLTLLAHAEKIENDEAILASARYYRYFPEAVDYHLTHAFDFYRLNIKRARFIGGFGKIHWLEQDDLLLPNPFSVEEEERIISHMNADHQKAINHYVQCQQLSLSGEPQMVGIDAEGTHLLAGKKIRRVVFDEKVTDTTEARNTLIALAQIEN